MTSRRIDKAYYRTGPQLRLWWPLNRSKRMWRAAHIHRRDYERFMIADWALSLFGLKEGRPVMGSPAWRRTRPKAHNLALASYLSGLTVPACRPLHRQSSTQLS